MITPAKRQEEPPAFGGQHPDRRSLAPESVANIQPIVVRHIAAVLRARGIDPQSAVDGIELCVDHLENDDFRVSYGQTSHMIRRAMQLLDDRHLGLRLGAQLNLVSWGHVYVGLLACANSHEMLEFAARFLPSGQGLLNLRCEYLPDGPQIFAHARFDEPTVAAFLIEKAFAAITHTCQSILGNSYHPISVSLTTPRPADLHFHAQVFRCPVHFAQTENSMQFPSRLVSIPCADALVVKMVRKALMEQTEFVGGSHELETSIVHSLKGRFSAPPTLAEIAAALRMGERTLRRRLAELGLGYAEILDRERKRRALALIRSGEYALKQVALNTGFSDERSLRRAVKRWTGKSPTSLRKQTNQPPRTESA